MKKRRPKKIKETREAAAKFFKEPPKREDLKGVVGEVVGFNYADEVKMEGPTIADDKPRCARCGYEFKLLTALGIGPQREMYCKPCEDVNRKLTKQIADWKEMDARIKAGILPKVKGFSWVEQMGRTL